MFLPNEHRMETGIERHWREQAEQEAKARLAATPGTREHHDRELDRIAAELAQDAKRVHRALAKSAKRPTGQPQAKNGQSGRRSRG